jgi:hypothetical protein
VDILGDEALEGVVRFVFVFGMGCDLGISFSKGGWNGSQHLIGKWRD